ncbi:MAG TPA: hypothetical protein VLQ80_34595, partial [Candidatus Saccharimonadia bacterium]|nr:hypothetical protein [Candidatus Saccharimonadia bacterium]
MRIAQGRAVFHWHLKSIEHGDARRARCIRHVSVPDTSSIGVANIAAVLLNVRDEHDLRMLW